MVVQPPPCSQDLGFGCPAGARYFARERRPAQFDKEAIRVLADVKVWRVHDLGSLACADWLSATERYFVRTSNAPLTLIPSP